MSSSWSSVAMTEEGFYMVVNLAPIALESWFQAFNSLFVLLFLLGFPKERLATESWLQSLFISVTFSFILKVSKFEIITDVTEVLCELELTIKKVKVSTTPDGRVMDLFFVTDTRFLNSRQPSCNCVITLMRFPIWWNYTSCLSGWSVSAFHGNRKW